MIHLAEIEVNLTRFCDLIGSFLYLANQVREIGFDFAKSISAFVFRSFYYQRMPINLRI